MARIWAWVPLQRAEFAPRKMSILFILIPPHFSPQFGSDCTPDVCRFYALGLQRYVDHVGACRERKTRSDLKILRGCNIQIIQSTGVPVLLSPGASVPELPGVSEV